MKEDIKIQEIVRTILSSITKREVEELTSSSQLATDLGLSSFEFLALREEVEEAFQIRILDSEVVHIWDVGSLLELIKRKTRLSERVFSSIEEKEIMPSAREVPSAETLDSSDVLRSDLEIGMSLTGRNNLAEGPLLQQVGNLRWQHISMLSGVPSRKIVDEDQERLYATFFFVDVVFPQARAMATYRENDRFTLVSTLKRYGLSILDGEIFLFDSSLPIEKKIPYQSLESASEDSVPYIRLCNAFVRQWKGAEWLKKSRPINEGMWRIPEITDLPDIYTLVKQKKISPPLLAKPNNISAILETDGEAQYNIIPDRDLNGAGLLYFANYPTILDVTERNILHSNPKIPFPQELLDRRTLVRRRSVYLCNATVRDTISVKLSAWIENPFLGKHPEPEIAPLRMYLEYLMHRSSDGRLMLRASAEKVFFGVTVGESPFVDYLRSNKGSSSQS